jgi:hypothetical protein
MAPVRMVTDEIRNISRLVNDRVPTRERAELATLGHGSRRRQNAQRQCSAIPITGVWEARAEPRPYVSSKLICRVALDRAANWLTFIWIVWGRKGAGR